MEAHSLGGILNQQEFQDFHRELEKATGVTRLALDKSPPIIRNVVINNLGAVKLDVIAVSVRYDCQGGIDLAITVCDQSKETKEQIVLEKPQKASKKR